MYRRCSRAALTSRLYRSSIACAVAWCATQGEGGTHGGGPAPTKPRRGVRRVAPTDAEMADLHAVEVEVAASSGDSILANVIVEPMYFASAADAVAGGRARERRDVFSDMGDNDDEDDETGRDICRNKGSRERHADFAEEDGGEGSISPKEAYPTTSGPLVDPVLQEEEAAACGALAGSIFERQDFLRSLNPVELVEMVTLYLRATENPRLVSADEEHALFPVIMERLNELHVGQMLDIVECHWARSTLVRYGTLFKDMVRDRIAVIASVAAKGAPAQPKHLDAASNNGNDNDGIDDDAAVNNDDDGSVYTHEATKGAEDPILLQARDEMNADGVLRCIVVMGMSAGRRKRDLQFFQALGIFLVHHINHYKDPHDLVRVLTAFARAKIVPPKGFLALLGRRFAVLNKRKPLGALPSYRAFVNLYKMGHDQMNSFRFLTNCIFETIDANVKAERKQQRMDELRRSKDTGVAPSVNATVEEGRGDTEKKETSQSTMHGDAATMMGDLDPQLLQVVKARERFRRLTELKPSMFTKLLLVLARFGAPHQQYLRPTTAPLILPMLRSFPPPSFSRLLRALRLFKTTDLDLIEPIIDHLAEHLGAANVIPDDVLQVVRIVSPPEVPVPRNLAKLLTLCEAVYSCSSNTSSGGHVVHPIRPNDMCGVATVLLHIQRKDDVPLEALDPLTRLMEVFAGRLNALMRLHVVSLTHVDIFTDLCRQQQHPDVSGQIAHLCKARRELNACEGDDEYYGRLDIDVRETFHKIMVVNDYNTYGQYRPTPGVLQVDFRQALTEVSAFDVLEATHLFAQAFPNALQPTVERHLSRSILAKLGNSGEEVITEEHTIVLRPPRELLLTKEDLVKFVDLVQLTPLKRVKTSPVVWRFIEGKAQRLQMNEVLKVAKLQQEEQQHQQAAHASV